MDSDEDWNMLPLILLLLPLANGQEGGRLLLTPSLHASNVQDLCKITSPDIFGSEMQMYSGFLTVNSTSNANMFFWFVKSAEGYDTAPLILWLGGGDGVGEPSTLGLLSEVGPYTVGHRNVAEFNSYHWTKNHSMLFIDAPVGVGFSYAQDAQGLSSTVQDVADHLHEALQQFLTIFPEMQNRDFYVAAQGFAAQFATCLGKTLEERKATASKTLNLKGMLLGSANLVPLETFDNAEYLFYTGLIDLNTYNAFLSRERQIQTLYTAENYQGALAAYDAYQARVKSTTGYDSLHNLVKLTDDYDGFYRTYIASENVREALHVGDATFSDGSAARNKLKPVLFRPYLDGIQYLLRNGNFSVLFYSGNLDMQFPYRGSGVEQYTDIIYPSREQYLDASRGYWNDGTVSEAYGQVGGNLYELLIRNAGRRVGREKRILAQEMVARFTQGTLSERLEYL